MLLSVLFLIDIYCAENKIFSKYDISHDSDSNSIHEISLVYKKLFRKKQYFEISIGNSLYREFDEGIRYDFIKFKGRNNFSDGFFIECGIKLLNNDDWKPIVYNISIVPKKEGLGRIEFFTERSIVDSHLAIENKYLVDTHGVSFDLEIGRELLLTGVVFYQYFNNDDNKRFGRVAQIVYSPQWLSRFYIKGRGRWIDADYNPDEYFSPLEYRRYFILFGYSLPIFNEKYSLNLEIGPSMQYVEKEKERGLDYKADIKGWISDSIGLEIFYASTSNYGGYEYWYNWGGILLKYAW